MSERIQQAHPATNSARLAALRVSGSCLLRGKICARPLARPKPRDFRAREQLRASTPLDKKSSLEIKMVNIAADHAISASSLAFGSAPPAPASAVRNQIKFRANELMKTGKTIHDQ
jgi:hypothetical protein